MERKGNSGLIMIVSLIDYCVVTDFILASNRDWFISRETDKTFRIIYGSFKSARTTSFWSDDPFRHLVVATAPRFPRFLHVHRLFNVGGVSGKSLLARSGRRELSLAILFAGNFWDFSTRVVWQTFILSDVADFFTGFFCIMGAGRISFHLLLLSRRLLQRILGRPNCLRRRRAAQKVSR